MNLYQYPYSGEADKESMSALAREFPEANQHVIDLPYRLSSWALDEPQNIGLWFDERGDMMGWAILQTPFWTVDIVCHPTVEGELYKEILKWADERARAIINSPFGHPVWFVMVYPDQVERIRELEAAGFACQADVGENSWSQVLMRRTDSSPVQIYHPPSGYTVRSLAGETEVDAYVELHRSVFESKNMTTEWRQRTLEHPAYKRDLDIVVETPEGQFAAFCICWFDESSQSGQVEPLGCHKDFRAKALGRVALSEGLHRLQTLGAQSIFVRTDSYRNTAFRLYESFGLDVFKDVLVYRKEYGK